MPSPPLPPTFLWKSLWLTITLCPCSAFDVNTYSLITFYFSPLESGRSVCLQQTINLLDYFWFLSLIQYDKNSIRFYLFPLSTTANNICRKIWLHLRSSVLLKIFFSAMETARQSVSTAHHPKYLFQYWTYIFSISTCRHSRWRLTKRNFGNADIFVLLNLSPTLAPSDLSWVCMFLIMPRMFVVTCAAKQAVSLLQYGVTGCLR